MTDASDAQAIMEALSSHRFKLARFCTEALEASADFRLQQAVEAMRAADIEFSDELSVARVASALNPNLGSAIWRQYVPEDAALLARTWETVQTRLRIVADSIKKVSDELPPAGEVPS